MSVSRDTVINVKDESAVRSIRISDLVNKEWKIWNGFEWSVGIPHAIVQPVSMVMVTVMVYDGLGGSVEHVIRCTKDHRWVMEDGKKLHTYELQLGFRLREWKNHNGMTFKGVIFSIMRLIGDFDTTTYDIKEIDSRMYVANGVLIGESITND